MDFKIKNLFLFSLCAVGSLISSLLIESVYTHSITTIEGVNHSMNEYQGKKIMVITLPVEQSASADSLLHSLDSLGTAYLTNLVIIGVPAYEDGYTIARKAELQQWYRNILGNHIVVTEGMYTRKSSGVQQHGLFKWLTDKDRNTHFNEDVTGPKEKFMIRASGELFGVLGSQTRVGGATVHRLLHTQ